MLSIDGSLSSAFLVIPKKYSPSFSQFGVRTDDAVRSCFLAVKQRDISVCRGSKIDPGSNQFRGDWPLVSDDNSRIIDIELRRTNS